MEKNNSGSVKRFLRSKIATIILILVVIVIGFWLLNKTYLKPDNIRTIMYSCSLSGTLGVGISICIIAGMPDLSAGAVGCLAGILISFWVKAGLPWGLGLLVVLLFGAVAGICNAGLVCGLGFTPFIATLAMASVWEGLAFVLTNACSVSVANDAFWALGNTRIIGLPLPFVIMSALYLVEGLICWKTKFGRSIYMVGGNENAARLAGINPKKIKSILLVNCSVCSAFGGVIMTARMHTGNPNSILGTELDGITAAVLGGIAFTGGTGGMMGAYLGLLMLNTFTNGLVVIGIGSYWQIVASGVLLIVALVIDYFSSKARARALRPHVA